MRWWVSLLVSILMLTGCGVPRPQSVSNASPLIGPTWELILIGTDEWWAGAQPAHFSLSDGGYGLQLHGSDGCNRLQGTARLGEGRLIAISQLTSTRMACAGHPQAPHVIEILSSAHRYLIDHDRLIFMGRDGHVLGGFQRQR